MTLNTYTLNDIMEATKRQFGDESGVQITDADITRWANQAITEINSKNKVLRKSANNPLPTSYVSSFPVPDDCMIPTGVIIALRNDAPATLKLESMGLNEFLSQFPESLMPASPSGHGEPRYWTVFENSILFFPTLGLDPSRTGFISITYVPQPKKLETGEDIIPLPDRYFDRIMEFVMSKAYELDENWQGHSTQRQLFEGNLSSLMNAETDMEGPYPVIRDTYGW